ncbi:MAG: hypothetical protein L0Y66_04715 [Myxococcaceae bacterium]|nr:hypothetical protein [Myxococcaceae bacterium]MCI0673013.1 hypothetical protein [Myxococcaceae bacterium]
MLPLRNDGVNSDQQERPIMEPPRVSDRVINPQDAEHFDAGMAADPRDADLIGAPPYEQEPTADDILPDQIRRFPGVPSEEDLELTARPRAPLRYCPPEELHEG